MPNVPRFTLQAALLSQGGRCFYCNRPLVMTIQGRTKQPRNAATADHLTPAALGGTEALWNIVAACSPCNYTKGGRRPTKMELARKAGIAAAAYRARTDPLVAFRGTPCRRSRLLEQLERARRSALVTDGAARETLAKLIADLENAIRC